MRQPSLHDKCFATDPFSPRTNLQSPYKLDKPGTFRLIEARAADRYAVGVERFAMSRLPLRSLALSSLVLLAPIAVYAEGEVQGPPSLPAASDAPAPVANGQKFGAWVVSCEALGVGRTACFLTQQLLRDTDRAFVAELLAFASPDGQHTYMSARVPTGAYLPAGLAMRPENSDAVTNFTYQSCGRDFCEALAEIGGADGSLPGEGPYVASFRPSLAADPFVFRFSMDGLAEGLVALRTSEQSSQ